MTVEIRELIIKTEIQSSSEKSNKLSTEELMELKQQIIRHCKRELDSKSRTNSFNR